MPCVVVATGAVVGVDGVPVQVEVDLLNRLPCMVIVGLPDGAVRESGDRVRSAIQQAGFEFPKQRVVVNLAPADLKKQGTAFDLPIAVGVLAAHRQFADAGRLARTVFLGELSLEGRLKRVRGALAVALMAADAGAERIVVPAECAGEAAVAEGIEVLGARDLAEVIAWLEGKGTLASPKRVERLDEAESVDLCDVHGQFRARRALEVAAAGGHNLLMVGPPGCGKTMLAARMPTILPSLSFAEAVDITRIYSVAGLLDEGQGLVTRRPFRAPHHSISMAGMIGNAALQPGEVSLAHHGVLFLDEVPEFRRSVLEVLRGPLEDRQVTLSRARGTVRFPASIALVAAANPCPCGFAGHPDRPCKCVPGQLERYRARLSGPLLDRIDLQVWVQPVDPDDLVGGRTGEPSAAVRERVERARAIQRRRFAGTGLQSNAELSGRQIREAADPSAKASRVLQDILETHGLSARAWARILKVARTIADLDGAARVGPEQILEAASYRVPASMVAS